MMVILHFQGRGWQNDFFKWQNHHVASDDTMITWHSCWVFLFFFRKPLVSPQATFAHHEAAVLPRLIFPRSPKEEKNLTKATACSSVHSPWKAYLEIPTARSREFSPPWKSSWWWWSWPPGRERSSSRSLRSPASVLLLATLPRSFHQQVMDNLQGCVLLQRDNCSHQILLPFELCLVAGYPCLHFFSWSLQLYWIILVTLHVGFHLEWMMKGRVIL